MAPLVKMTYTLADGLIADLTYPAQPSKHKVTLRVTRGDLARIIVGISEYIRHEERKRKNRKGRAPRGWRDSEYACMLADLMEFKEGLEKAFKKALEVAK